MIHSQKNARDRDNWFEAYFIPHITAVYEYGIMIGVPKPLLAVHDNSKLVEPHIEAWVTRQGGVMNTPQYYSAWLYHYRSEDHHWQHWLVHDPTVSGNVLALDMDHIAILHMYADWHGASQVYGENGNIQRFLNDNYQSMILSAKTRSVLDKIVTSDGYTVRDAPA